MATKNKELYNHLTPIELRAINDLLCLLNMHFLDIDPESDGENGDVNFMNYFSELDFSRMSDSSTAIDALDAISKLNPKIKRFIFAKIINATQHMIFWKTERDIVLYLLRLNIIGAKEVMMLNCSYILRDLLPYNGCNYEVICDNFFDFEMTIQNEEDFHCFISLNTGFNDREGFVYVFIDYDTVKCIRSYLYTPDGSVDFISNQLDVKNYFKKHGNYMFSYEKAEPSGDAIRNGVWFKFNNIQLK